MNKSKQSIKLFLLVILAVQVIQCSSGEESAGEIKEVHLKAVEELRIGVAEGDDEYMFGNIDNIAIGKEGRIFVEDRQVPIIRMYDKEGKFIKNIGREGRGPGEYTGISGLKTFKDGGLAIWNVGLKRASVFDEDGNYITSHFVGVGLHAPDLFKVGQKNGLYVKTTINTSRDLPNWHFAWLKISAEGEVADTIEVPLDEEDRPQSFVLFTNQGDAHPFIERPLSTMNSTGHLVYAESNSKYEFELMMNGKSVSPVKKEFNPVVLLPGEKKQWEKWTELFASRGAESKVPDYKPAFKQIKTDTDGRIWIWKYVEAEFTDKDMGVGNSSENNWWEPPVFDIFMPDGEYYGTVKLPINANFKDAKGDYLVAKVTEEPGTQYVVRYRLVN